MFHQLLNHNDDLRRLVQKGYAVALDGGYLVVRDIPYLDAQRQLQWGAFVAKLEFADKLTVQQDNHQIWFAGSVPHGLDAKPISNLGGGPTSLPLGTESSDVVVQRRFSNKPAATGRYVDFFDKIESYLTLIAGPAMELHNANPRTFRTKDTMSSSVFKAHDTLTSRAEILDLSAKFGEDVVAVIGLGGTGAYVLEFLVKTPVKEIRGFDLDLFHVHNVFRSPGRLEESELRKPKASVYQGRYENFRHGLKLERKLIDAASTADLHGVTFAFVCVDKGSSRSQIFDLLIAKKIPFIDVGMGLDRKRGPINGMIRVTYYSAEASEAVRAKGLAEMSDPPDDIYRTNIQIGEINALNACLAVIRFKQLRGFYFAEPAYHHLLFEIGDLKTVGESEL
ncbi:MAG: ThiF family adenylyltransferase [Ktedonobacteraceae bacterium]